ncbi:MAG TPA: c-type cytochrome [Thermodesulfobacteriota bacterium]|nr:c-type cytochrome [Thermodesulfobacteriota bacterium]
MRRLIGLGVLALSVAVASSALASGEDIFKSKCLPCHGAAGAGTAMAPAFKGNAFIKTGSDDDISKVIAGGRAGAAKKYKEFALDMPPAPLTPQEISDVVHYLKGLAAQ